MADADRLEKHIGRPVDVEQENEEKRVDCHEKDDQKDSQNSVKVVEEQLFGTPKRSILCPRQAGHSVGFCWHLLG